MASDVLIRTMGGWKSIHANGATPDSVQAADAAGNFHSLTGGSVALGPKKFIRNKANNAWVPLDTALTAYWNRPYLHYVIPRFTLLVSTPLGGTTYKGNIRFRVNQAITDTGTGPLQIGFIGASGQVFEYKSGFVEVIGGEKVSAPRPNPFTFIMSLHRAPEPVQYMYIHLSYDVDHAPDPTVLRNPNVYPHVITPNAAVRIIAPRPAGPTIWTAAGRSTLTTKTFTRGSRWTIDMSNFVRIPTGGYVVFSVMGLPAGLTHSVVFLPNRISGAPSTPGVYKVTLVATSTTSAGISKSETINCTWTVV